MKKKYEEKIFQSEQGLVSPLRLSQAGRFFLHTEKLCIGEFFPGSTTSIPIVLHLFVKLEDTLGGSILPDKNTKLKIVKITYIVYIRINITTGDDRFWWHIMMTMLRGQHMDGLHYPTGRGRRTGGVPPWTTLAAHHKLFTAPSTKFLSFIFVF